MNLIKKVVFIYLLLIGFSLSLNSCCTKSYRIIGKGIVNAVNNNYYDRTELDTISGEFKVEWILEDEVVSNNANFGIIETAYATTCENQYINDIVDSTYTLIFDKDFTYDSLLVPAGTNVLDIYDVDIRFEHRNAYTSLAFGKKFTKKAVFDFELYEFKLNAKTNNDFEFENGIILLMNIN